MIYTKFFKSDAEGLKYRKGKEYVEFYQYFRRKNVKTSKHQVIPTAESANNYMYYSLKNI